MIDDNDIARLMAIGARHLEELMGARPAAAFGSDPEEEEAASSLPANTADGTGVRPSL